MTSTARWICIPLFADLGHCAPTLQERFALLIGRRVYPIERLFQIRNQLENPSQFSGGNSSLIVKNIDLRGAEVQHTHPLRTKDSGYYFRKLPGQTFFGYTTI